MTELPTPTDENEPEPEAEQSTNAQAELENMAFDVEPTEHGPALIPTFIPSHLTETQSRAWDGLCNIHRYHEGAVYLGQPHITNTAAQAVEPGERLTMYDLLGRVHTRNSAKRELAVKATRTVMETLKKLIQHLAEVIRSAVQALHDAFKDIDVAAENVTQRNRESVHVSGDLPAPTASGTTSLPATEDSMETAEVPTKNGVEPNPNCTICEGAGYIPLSNDSEETAYCRCMDDLGSRDQ